MEALTLALQHPAVLAGDQTNVCSLLQVCKAWNIAVRNSAGTFTDVRLALSPPDEEADQEDQELWIAPQLQQFTTWLTRHCSLVRSIKIDKKVDTIWRCHHLIEIERTAVPLLAVALRSSVGAQVLQHSAAQTTAPAAARQLRLQSFSSGLMSSPVLLSALPAASLTKLSLSPSPSSSAASHAAAADAISRLSNLERLDLCSDGKLPDVYVTAVTQLQQLTTLQLSSVSFRSGVQQLPAQLLRLKLKMQTPAAEMHFSSRPRADGPLDLRHLTCLQKLQLTITATVPEGSGLPEQLQELHLECYHRCEVVNELGLSRLTALRVLVFSSPSIYKQMSPLTKLSQLQHVSLRYCGTNNRVEETVLPVVPGTSVWPQLAKLRSLEVCVRIGLPCMQNLLADLSRVFGLTSLSFVVHVTTLGPGHMNRITGQPDAPFNAHYPLCEAIGKLTTLEHLRLRDLGARSLHACGIVSCSLTPQPNDAMHLSALTGLTSLHVSNLGSALSTPEVAAVLRSMSKLRWLQVSKCDALRSGNGCAATFQAVESLRHLRHLGLGGVLPDLAQQGLEEMQQLTQLTFLSLS